MNYHFFAPIRNAYLLLANDGKFEEGKHPRDGSGKFGSGGGKGKNKPKSSHQLWREQAITNTEARHNPDPNEVGKALNRALGSGGEGRKAPNPFGKNDPMKKRQ